MDGPAITGLLLDDRAARPPVGLCQGPARSPTIERHFAILTNWGGGLGPLPAWIRTLKRVRRWVDAKLALTAVKRQLAERTYVN